MVTLAYVLEAVIAVILFVILVVLFYNVFGTGECDKLANNTAVDLADAVSRAALEEDVSSWNGKDVPPDENTDYYTTVPIRLCEKDRLKMLTTFLSAQSPTYILTYETFPESGFAWSETQPFSGGAMESLFNYAIMKWGAKSVFFISKSVVKFIKNGITYGFRTAWDMVLGDKIRNGIEEIRGNKIVRWTLEKLGASDAAEEPLHLTEEWIKKYGLDNLPKGKFDEIITNFANWKITEGKDYGIEKYLMEIGFLEKVEKNGELIPAILERNREYIVTEEGRSFMAYLIENNPDLSYAERFYIPSKYRWVENLKLKHFYPWEERISSWWKNTWVKRNVIDKTKKFYDRVKNGFNKYFDTENYLDELESTQKAGVIKRWALTNRDDFRVKVGENWEEFKEPFEKILGRSIEKAEDLDDAELFYFINKYDRWFNAKSLLIFSDIGSTPVTHASEALGNEMAEEARYIKSASEITRTSDPTYAYRQYQEFINKYGKDWDSFSLNEKNAIMARLMKNYGDPSLLTEDQMRVIWNDAQGNILKEGAHMFDAIDFKPSAFAKKVNNVKKSLYAVPFQRFEFSSLDEFKNSIPDFYLKPVATDSTLDTLKSYAYTRTKRGIFLDLNRIGEGPIAPYNLISSPYAIDQGLSMATQVTEGGCAKNSICMIERGKATGPTETSSAYSLDKAVPESTTVKLWRPKPDAWSRLPVGINTILFYASVPENPRFYVVSPCFAMAKVWKDKSSNTVFVKIEKNRKCETNCTQELLPSWKIPYLSDIPLVGQFFQTSTYQLDSVDTPNYCYADEEFVWGENLGKGGDNPSEFVYFGEFAGLTAACSVATQGADIRACLKASAYATIGTLMYDTASQSSAYKNVPSWQRQETGWGYWNYQKAADICDNIDFIQSIFGSFSSKPGSLQKISKKVSSNKVVKAVKSQFGVSDICYSIQLIGDTSLSWPIKTPAWEFWRKAADLDEKCMQNSAAKCVWLEKCNPAGNDCPGGMYCDPAENICKKSP